jgi:predicted amidophosphoribosyltransferase
MTTLGEPVVPTCRVCGEPVDETNSAICNGCGLRFHLALRQDQVGKDCGNVWVNEEFMALEFGCFLCLRGESPPGEEEPPVGVVH